MEDRKKVLITGVTGQDGSLMADYLLNNTDNIVVGGIRRLSVKNHENIEHLVENDRFKLIDLDVADQINLENVIQEEKPDYSTFLDDLWNESQNEKYSDEILDKLNDLKPGDVAQLYLDYRANAKETTADLTAEQATELQKSVGGEKKYNEMLKWASTNFDEAEIDRYDKVMESGNPDAAYFAVQALAAKYNDGVGVDGQLLTGKPAKAQGDQYRSQAEVVRAMSDPRYDRDPAYRQDVYDKLERSNLQF